MKHIRKTYAKIILQKHPFSDSNALSPESLAKPDESDGTISDEIISILEKGSLLFGKSDGEWKYLDKHKRGTYINSIRRPQASSLQPLLANMFRNDSTYGIVTPSYSEVDQVVIKDQILLDLDTCYEFTCLKGVHPLLLDREWGNPYGLIVDRKILPPDSPRHYYYAEKLASLVAKSTKKRIVEIGGGYGGLALMLRRLNDTAPYVIIDLFETSLLQYYFLKKAGIKVAFVLDPNELPEPDTIAIVPSDISDAFLSQLTDVGVVFNAHSFSEMSQGTVEHYFALIQDHIKPMFIYHDNSNFLLFPDSVRHVEILASNFPVDHDRYRLVQMNISPFLGGSGRFREFLYERLPS